MWNCPQNWAGCASMGHFPCLERARKAQGASASPRLQSRLDWSGGVAGQLGARQGLRVSGLRSPGLSRPPSLGPPCPPWPQSLVSQASWSLLASESRVSGLLVCLGLRVSCPRPPGLSGPPSLVSQASWSVLTSESRASGVCAAMVSLFECALAYASGRA